MSFDWISICEFAGTMVLMVIVLFLAAARSKLIAVASLFIGLSAGVMLWLLTDMVVDPFYEVTTYDPFWFAFTSVNVGAFVALCLGVWKMNYKPLLIAAALSSFSLLAPFGVLGGVLIWWDHRRGGTMTSEVPLSQEPISPNG